MQSHTYDAREYFAPAPNKVQAAGAAASASASNAAAAGATNFAHYAPMQPGMLSQTGMPQQFHNFNPYANPPPFFMQQPYGAFCVRYLLYYIVAYFHAVFLFTCATCFFPGPNMVTGYRDPMAALAAANLQPFGSGGFMQVPSIGLFMTPDATMSSAQSPAQWGGYSRMRTTGGMRGGSGGPGASSGSGRSGAGRSGASTSQSAAAGGGSGVRHQLSQIGQQAPLSQMQGGLTDASSQDAAGIAALSGLHSVGAETASQTLSFLPADVVFPVHDFTSQQSQSVDNALLSQR